VRTHSKRLYEKLGVHSQPQLIKMVVFDLDVAESG
jgi:DNA-binding CsgD family transcriptional regulator